MPDPRDGPDAVIRDDLDRVVGDGRLDLTGAGRGVLLADGRDRVRRPVPRGGRAAGATRSSGGAPCVVTAADAPAGLVVPAIRRRSPRASLWSSRGEPGGRSSCPVAPTTSSTGRPPPIRRRSGRTPRAASGTRSPWPRPSRRSPAPRAGGPGRQRGGLRRATGRSARVPRNIRTEPDDVPPTGSTYAAAKRESERRFRAIDGDVRIARVFSLTGPYQDLGSAFAVPDLIRPGRPRAVRSRSRATAAPAARSATRRTSPRSCSGSSWASRDTTSTTSGAATARQASPRSPRRSPRSSAASRSDGQRVRSGA